MLLSLISLHTTSVILVPFLEANQGLLGFVGIVIAVCQSKK